jgi:CubicO group peptidase (beta-lactamase class C family)
MRGTQRRPHATSLLVALIVLALLGGCGQEQSSPSPITAQGAYQGEYWPTAGWRSCRPEEVGMDSARLERAYEYAANPAVNSRGLVIIKSGYVVAEAYFGGFEIGSRHESYSVAKSFLSALVGIAIDQGHLASTDERVSSFFPAWQGADTEPAKTEMTVRHLLTMSSGLEWNEQDYYVDTSQNDAFRMGEWDDYVAYVLAKPSEFNPGSVWRYSSGDSMLLSGIIQEATGLTAFRFAATHLLAPLGLSEVQWASDRAGHTVGGWGVQATTREFAKFAYLYLRQGRWEGRQVVPEAWVIESLRPVSDRIDFYGYQWWLAPALDGYEGSAIPSDTFLAWGIYGQQLFVIPSRQLVVVRVADDPGSPAWDEVEFLTRILAADLGR